MQILEQKIITQEEAYNIIEGRNKEKNYLFFGSKSYKKALINLYYDESQIVYSNEKQEQVRINIDANAILKKDIENVVLSNMPTQEDFKDIINAGKQYLEIDPAFTRETGWEHYCEINFYRMYLSMPFAYNMNWLQKIKGQILVLIEKNNYDNSTHNIEKENTNVNQRIVDSIISKIEEMPSNTETSIAELIKYNPKINFIDQLTQGEIYFAVEKECIKKGIILERIESGFGGLAYYYRFKKNSSNKFDESLKLSNGRYAANLKTKEVFDNYMSKIDKYNEQVINGNKSDTKMSDLLNEYTNTFYDETLEAKQKKIVEDYNNREKDTRINDLLTEVDDKLKKIEQNKNS